MVETAGGASVERETYQTTQHAKQDVWIKNGIRTDTKTKADLHEV